MIHTQWYPNPHRVEEELINQIKWQFLQVNFYFVLTQFEIERACFSQVFSTYVIFYAQIVLIYFLRAFLAANVFISSRKVVPHDQQRTLHRFKSHQQKIGLNDWQKLQSTPNKVSVFGSSLYNCNTIRSVYILILSTVYSLSSNHTKIKDEM